MERRRFPCSCRSDTVSTSECRTPVRAEQHLPRGIIPPKPFNVQRFNVKRFRAAYPLPDAEAFSHVDIMRRSSYHSRTSCHRASSMSSPQKVGWSVGPSIWFRGDGPFQLWDDGADVPEDDGALPPRRMKTRFPTVWRMKYSMTAKTRYSMVPGAIPTAAGPRPYRKRSTTLDVGGGRTEGPGGG